MQQADRSLRSVFVGNIPYDATEEKLRDIFSAVGPVLGFRIVFDRETGKPKGYGFCEYKDEETATSAIRNLNGHDLGGRQLRVDSASNERARDEPDQQKGQQNHQQQQQQQNQHGIGAENQQLLQQQPLAEPLVDAQTVINNVLCSLPPENLFEICKQMKISLLVNPNETRQLLVQNPQLSFALLQTLVMIKAIDAQTAMNTLHKQLMQPAPLQPAMPPMMAMMQPQVLAPYAFVGQQPTGIPPVQPGPPPPAVVAVPQQAPAPIPPPTPTLADPRMNPANPRLTTAPVDPRLAAADPRLNAAVSTTATDPRLMAADPRLARQQQQQQQQQQQHPNPQQIQQPGWPYVGV